MHWLYKWEGGKEGKVDYNILNIVVVFTICSFDL